MRNQSQEYIAALLTMYTTHTHTHKYAYCKDFIGTAYCVMYATYWIASSAWGCRDCWLFPLLPAAVHTVLSRQEHLEQGRLPTLTETQGVAGGCGGLHQVHKRQVPVRYTPKYPCSNGHDELHLPPTKPSLSKNHGRMAHTPSYIRSQLECQILHRQQASAEFLSPIIPAHSRPVENKQIKWAN